jgi:cytochrome c2
MNRINLPVALMFVVALGLCGVIASAQSARHTPRATATAAPATMTPAPTETATGDPEAGAALFSTFQPGAGIACATCHRIDSDERLIGPGLLTIGERAATRVENLSADAYIRQSIIDPSAYVVEDYPDIMTKNFDRVFTEAELNDLVAFLFSLNETEIEAE